MRLERRQRAEDNERCVELGYYDHPTTGRVLIGDAVRRATDATVTYDPDRLAALLAAPPSTAQGATTVEISGETSIRAVVRLGVGAGTIGVLNFASARNPGGGYLRGSRAQEEDLCRCSALYTCLCRATGFYDVHRAENDPFYSHRVICSPGVPVFRDDRGEPLPAPLPVTFLTCPAPNAGRIADADPAALARVPAVLAERSAGVLAVAAAHHVDTLILGAWGCGVFRNSPRDVAAAFAAHLGPDGRFGGRFARVVFAVFDSGRDQATLAAFRSGLAHLAGEPGRPRKLR